MAKKQALIDAYELSHRLCNGFITNDGDVDGRFTDLFADNGISQYDLHDESTPYGKMMSIVIRIFQSIPTVDPVKHGKWKMYNTYYACSLCGYEDMGHMYKYCPECGAKMDGEND